MADFTQLLVQNLNQFGLYQYVLPFILLFAITFGIMENAHILSKKRHVQFILAFTITSFAIISPIGASFANFFALFAAKIGVVMVSVLFGLMTILIGYKAVAELTGKKVELEFASSLVFWISILVVVGLFIMSGGIDLIAYGNDISWLRPSEEFIYTVTVIGFVIVLFAFLFFVSNAEGRRKARERRHHQKFMRKLIGFGD